jgi:hypothetical protein
MKIKVVRRWFDDVSTIGELYINDKWECYTLEDTVRDGKKVDGATAIPYGIYKVIIDLSNRFKRMMPHILDVPNFSGVRIHNGNTSDQTEGCILVGQTKEKDFIGNSKTAFKILFDKIQKAVDNKEEIEIEIVKG